MALQQTDVFIYQELIEEKWHDYFPLIITRLPASCQKICIPKLNFTPYWPTNTSAEPRFTPTKEYQSGLYPYGDSLLSRLCLDQSDPDEIYSTYFNADFSDLFDLDHIFENCMAYFSAEHNAKDIGISPFIIDNFKRIRLFNTYNHPNYLLFDHIFKNILDKLNVSNDKTAILTWPEIFMDYVVPIHPSVIRHYGLTFSEPECYPFYGTPVSLRQYILGYIKNTHPSLIYR